MTTTTRRRIHYAFAIFFAVQVPAALMMRSGWPVLFEAWWKQYLIVISLYAIVSTHWAAAAAETPFDDEDDA